MPKINVGIVRIFRGELTGLNNLIVNPLFIEL